MTLHRHRLPTAQRVRSDGSNPPAAIRLPRAATATRADRTASFTGVRTKTAAPAGERTKTTPQVGERTAARAALREQRKSGRLLTPRQRTGRLLRELAMVVVVALVLSLGIKTFVAQSFWIPSQSMENTLIPGDRVVVSKFTPGPFALQRGDVIVFHDPGHWLHEPNAKRSGISGAAVSVLQFVGLYPSGDNDLIKRVIGLPGDHVKCCNTRGQITVNGVGLSEPYIYPGGGTDQKTFSVTVPAGRVWVMGDNRGDSSDSRFHDDGTGRTGSVPESNIIGRAVMIVWPVGRMSWLSNYSTTFDKVPKP